MRMSQTRLVCAGHAAVELLRSVLGVVNVREKPDLHDILGKCGEELSQLVLLPVAETEN